MYIPGIGTAAKIGSFLFKGYRDWKNEEKQGKKEALSRELLTILKPSKETGNEEIEAIQGRRLFKGMSQEALEYMLGRTMTINAWAGGGKQLVYDPYYVYIDRSGKVVNWSVHLHD